MPPQNETGQERTEEATPRRREKAFQDGRVPRSQELSSAVVLLGAVIAVVMGGGAVLGRMLVAVQQRGAQWIAVGGLSERDAAGLLRSIGTDAVVGIAPFVLGAASLVLTVNLLQARGVFSVVPVTPKLSHISPLNGLKRIFSVQSLATLIKSVLKLTFLVAVAYLSFSAAWGEIISLSGHEPSVVVEVIQSVSIKLAAVAGLAFLCIAGADYVFQVRQHARGLRMTRQEVVQEHKETEGDPLIKSRIRAVALAMSRKRMLTDVAMADVVVTNPTHLAVALKYDLEVAAAPIVVAMGARKLAARIKLEAAKANVPLVENKPLAQALFATARLGEPIPPALYMAVAEVLAFVYRSRNSGPASGGPR